MELPPESGKILLNVMASARNGLTTLLMFGCDITLQMDEC